MDAQLSKETIFEADDAVQWANLHGLVVGHASSSDSADTDSAALTHAPLSVRPTCFPRDSFMKAKRAAPVFNKLIDRVARDDSYLQRTLERAAEFDEFTASLLSIHKQTASLREARQGSELVLAINRSDYMLDEPSTTMLQVELNTIASSFGCLSTLVSRMHAYVFNRSAEPAEELERLPPNDATGCISDALAAAVARRGISGGVVMMVVQPAEKNSFDQQWLQFALWERHSVRTIRRTLDEVGASAALGRGGELSVGGIPVAVVYFRAGYAPSDYAGPHGWEDFGASVDGHACTENERLLEESTAVQCPSVAYQLAGTKKIQQELASPGMLERFLDDDADIALARSCFAGLWSLDDRDEASVRDVIADARQRPDDYVLKPQREGGGNNLYGEQLRDRLGDTSGLSSFILMQRIRPPIHRTLMVRGGKLSEVDSLSELGIYGTFLRHGSSVLLNEEAGHLVRTKAATSDEGGVAAGFAVLDSPYLTDDG